MTAATTDQQRPQMDCQRVMREELSERYVSGQLDEPERQAFEDHYFDCPQCSREVEAYVLLKGELARSEPARSQAERPRATMAAWLGLAAALVAVSALIVWRLQPGSEPPSSVASTPAPPDVAAAPEAGETPPAPVFTLAELAEVSPPVYRPATLRSTPSPAVQRFRQAMESYGRGDYGEALPGLEEAAGLDASLPQVHFFLGACYLFSGHVERAIGAWRATVGLGESAYLEEAHFYLAKALLRAGDTAGARAELEATMALAGDRQAEARDLLRQLQSVR